MAEADDLLSDLRGLTDTAYQRLFQRLDALCRAGNLPAAWNHIELPDGGKLVMTKWGPARDPAPFSFEVDDYDVEDFKDERDYGEDPEAPDAAGGDRG